jgi:hypothetical protein
VHRSESIEKRSSPLAQILVAAYREAQRHLRPLVVSAALGLADAVVAALARRAGLDRRGRGGEEVLGVEESGLPAPCAGDPE